VIFALLLLLAQDAPKDPLPEGEGKKELMKVCTDCHGPEQIIAKKRTKAEWDDVISDMVQKGATGTDEEFDKIVAYLAKNFGK
jgi:mono/diheme cytochrome c family protein